ncbi:MAG TPA: NAD(P)/FAD-dependent oxidoreductase [Caulobacteraceae bacterium]
MTYAIAATRPLKIAIIGSGISGMSAAWLLSQRHNITLYEADTRLGGHSHTVDAPVEDGHAVVDMGFIVYNEANYPNLVALFDHLGVPTKPSNMGFSVSLDGGRIEYGGDSLPALFAQPRNLLSPRFWSMLKDLVRFYREAPTHACALHTGMTSLGEYLDAQGYGSAFQDDHLLPQAAAIWSASVNDIRAYPAAAFIRFCENHGLLKIIDRPLWRTVEGGSRAYVSRLTALFAGKVRQGLPVTGLTRVGDGVLVRDAAGHAERYDHVVIATHADHGLGLLDDPTPEERQILGAFAYCRNRAVLHSDEDLMPVRRGTWSAWNYVGRAGVDGLCVTYWMNRLQDLPRRSPLFVTLNPISEPDPAKVIRTEVYDHPLFDAPALRAQERLWELQGRGNTWWCGSYFGSGFHEDGLQAGLAVAEALGGLKRPWTVADESARICLGPGFAPPSELERAA